MTTPRSMNGQTGVSCNYEFTSHSTAHTKVDVDNPIVGKALVKFSK
jgi:hypothetical protein